MKIKNEFDKYRNIGNITWTLDKFILVKLRTDSSWPLLNNILNVSDLAMMTSRFRNYPTMYKFPSKNPKAKLSNENLTDTLIPFITSIGEYARDNGNKEFYKRMQELLDEIQKP